MHKALFILYFFPLSAHKMGVHVLIGFGYHHEFTNCPKAVGIPGLPTFEGAAF